MAELDPLVDEKDGYDPDILDKYEYDKQAGVMQRFLWYCAGADKQLLLHCPQSDRVKIEGIGGTVLATAVLALCSGGYAFYTVFSPIKGLALSDAQQALHVPTMLIAIFFGLIWSLVIFNLDRFVVSSAGHGDGSDKITWGEMGRAIPRILMAMIIGFTLSKPLEIRIMKTEIEAELQVQQQAQEDKLNKQAESRYEESKARSQDQIATAQAKIDAREDELAKRYDEVKKQQADVDNETTARGGSGKAGCGKICEQLKTTLNQKMAAFEETKLKLTAESALLQAEIKKAKHDEEEALSDLKSARETNQRASRNLDGLIQRINIAHEISPVASWALTFLLLLIEVVPIFFKMMLTTGPYDYLVENQQAMVRAKYAIREIVETKPGDGSEVTRHGEFYQPMTVLEHQAGQLEVERNLTKIAQEAFEQAIKEDIERNPLKYVKTADTTA